MEIIRALDRAQNNLCPLVPILFVGPPTYATTLLHASYILKGLLAIPVVPGVGQPTLLVIPKTRGHEYPYRCEGEKQSKAEV